MKIIDEIRRVVVGRRERGAARKLKSCGPGVEFDFPVTLVFPERITLGKYVYLGTRSYLNGRGGLEIGDHSILGPETVIMSASHNHRLARMVPYDEVELLDPVTIGQCVWIGLRAIIMPGVTLGDGVIVGAGSTVTRSYAAGSIVAGNPAKVIGQRDMEHYCKCVENGAFYLQMKQKMRFAKIERSPGRGDEKGQEY